MFARPLRSIILINIRLFKFVRADRLRKDLIKKWLMAKVSGIQLMDSDRLMKLSGFVTW